VYYNPAILVKQVTDVNGKAEKGASEFNGTGKYIYIINAYELYFSIYFILNFPE
jgi:hypothetical protein